MVSKIFTAKEARTLSELNKRSEFDSIMQKIQEYASQGKKEFEIRDRPLFLEHEDELVSLGYMIKNKGKDTLILSWDI